MTQVTHFRPPDDQPPVPRAPYEYEDIPRVDSPQKFQKLSANWDNLIERISSLSDAALFERSATLHEDLVAALRAGIPRQRRGEVWKFLADYRRRVNPPRHSSASKRPSEGLYRSLLGELTVHQHEIFVDLGRTFPNIPYFAATMDRGQLALFNVLKVYSLYDEQVGYCQGLAFVAGVLLIHVSTARLLCCPTNTASPADERRRCIRSDVLYATRLWLTGSVQE